MPGAKHILAAAAVTLATWTLAYAHPSNKRSDLQCSLRGHPIYLPSGLDYPRYAWASWGITCRAPKPEGVEGAETTAPPDGRPVEWCGWWMRQHLGGHFGPEFNVARNWLNVGRPLPGPRPGVLGIKEHHVFQVVRVVGPDQVLAISGNDHGAVRTRMRPITGVIGWRDVANEGVTTGSPVSRQSTEGGIRNSNAVPDQVENETLPDGDY
jgi:hypothetical protein